MSNRKDGHVTAPASVGHKVRFEEGAHPKYRPEDLAGRFSQACFSHHALMGQFRRGLEINAHENLALIILWESGSMTMSEVGERIPLSRAAVTSLIDRLEAMGYVRRVPDKQDRRRTMLELTSHPWEKSAPLWDGYPADMAQLASGYTDVELAMLYRFLGDVRAVTSEHADRVRALSQDEIRERIGD